MSAEEIMTSDAALVVNHNLTGEKMRMGLVVVGGELRTLHQPVLYLCRDMSYT
jgi:hypothetical protein